LQKAISGRFFCHLERKLWETAVDNSKRGFPGEPFFLFCERFRRISISKCRQKLTFSGSPRHFKMVMLERAEKKWCLFLQNWNLTLSILPNFSRKSDFWTFFAIY
jgi:hypothetical protein